MKWLFCPNLILIKRSPRNKTKTTGKLKPHQRHVKLPSQIWWQTQCWMAAVESTKEWNKTWSAQLNAKKIAIRDVRRFSRLRSEMLTQNKRSQTRANVTSLTLKISEQKSSWKKIALVDVRVTISKTTKIRTCLGSNKRPPSKASTKDRSLHISDLRKIKMTMGVTQTGISLQGTLLRKHLVKGRRIRMRHNLRCQFQILQL